MHEHTLQWKNILEIKEIFTSLRSKILYLKKKKKFLKPRLPKHLKHKGGREVRKEGPERMVRKRC